MKNRTAALIASAVIAALAATVGAVLSSSASAADQSPTPPSVRSTISGW